LDVQTVHLDNVSASHSYGLFELVDEAICQTRFSRKEMVWLALHGSSIAAYCWLAFQDTEVGEIDRIIRPREDEVYIYDAFTRPDYRNNNLYSFLLTEICRFARERDFSRALIFTLHNNIPSQQGIQKAGFKRFQVIKYTRLLGISRYWYGELETGQRGVILIPK